MSCDDLKSFFFSVIKKDDPYREYKQLQVEHWHYAFLMIFKRVSNKNLPFFLDILSDEECWENTDTIHRIKFNRRVAAKKMVQLRSWKGRSNPLDDFDRYQIVCCCCLVEDIVALFKHFRRKYEIKSGDSVALNKLVKSLCREPFSDPLMGYWSHILGCTSEQESSSTHLYEHGLNLALDKYTGHVEAVEFFWHKIRSLSENELTQQKKCEIFMKTAVRAAGPRFSRYPELLEFCISQISPERYPELLKRDFTENRYFGSLAILQDNLCFDQFRKLFNCLNPDDVSENLYHGWLTFFKIEEYSEYYAKEAVKLFMHMWMAEKFARHRDEVLKLELCYLHQRGKLLAPFVVKNYMEPVWAILKKATSDQVKTFINSEEGSYMCSIMEERRDQSSLKTLFSFTSNEKA